MLTESQIEFRKGRITSSRWGRIMSGGLYGVLLEMIHGTTIERNLRMELGDIAEEEICRWAYEHIEGANEIKQQFEVEDSECRMIGAHVDMVVGVDELQVPVECKLVFPENAWQWRDGPPKYPVAQLQCQMMCLNASHGYIAAWIIDGNPEKRLYKIEADRSEWRRMRYATPILFEKYINPGVMPEGVWEENPEMMVDALAPLGRCGEIGLPKSFGRFLDVYEDGCATMRCGERQKMYAKAKIYQALGPAAKGLLPGGRSVEVKVSKNGAQRIVVAGRNGVVDE